MSLPSLLSIFVIFLAVAIYGALHSWLASLRVKAEAKQLLGSMGERAYRLVYNLVAFFLLLPIIALPATLPDHILYIIPMPWRLISLAIQGLALLILFIGVLQTGIGSFLGLNQLFAIQGDSEGLVTEGLYRFVRHPLYTAGLLLIWLIPVMTENTLALDISLTLYIMIGIVYEERKLLRTFGPSYEIYRKSTPKLVPRIHFIVDGHPNKGSGFETH